MFVAISRLENEQSTIPPVAIREPLLALFAFPKTIYVNKEELMNLLTHHAG